MWRMFYPNSAKHLLKVLMLVEIDPLSFLRTIPGLSIFSNKTQWVLIFHANMHLKLAHNILVCISKGRECFSVLKLFEFGSQFGRKYRKVSAFCICVATCM